MAVFDPSSSPQGEPRSEALRYIAAAHEAQKFGDLDAALQNARQALELDPQNDEALHLARELRHELVDVEMWEKKQGGRKKTGRVIFPIFVYAFLALLIVGLFWTKLVLPGEIFIPTSTPQPTLTLTPSLTPSPTATETPIPPTSTPIPTQTPTSIYSNAWAGLLVHPPEGIRPLFFIDDTQATFTGPLGYWETSTDRNNQAIGGSMHIVNPELPGEAEAIFHLDQPLSESGRYEVFISDPVANCGSDTWYLFSVGKLDSSGEFKPVDPLIGSNIYKYKTAIEQLTTGSLWASLGIYEYNAGDVIEVRFNPTAQVKPGDLACMDAVLIGKLPNLPDVTAYQLLSQNAIDPAKIMFWTDDQDSTTVFTPPEGWVKNKPGSWNWLGDSSLEYLVGAIDPQISWNLSHPLLPGKYQIYAWVSEKMRGKAIYQISLGHYPSIVFPDVPIDLGGKLPALVMLGEIEINNLPDASSTNKVKIVMKPGKGSVSGVLAGDVILFLKTP